MSVLKDDDLFVMRTVAALAALRDDASKILRSIPEKHICPDSAPCRHCEALRLIHLRIDDHLNQLEDANLLVVP